MVLFRNLGECFFFYFSFVSVLICGFRLCQSTPREEVSDCTKVLLEKEIIFGFLFHDFIFRRIIFSRKQKTPQV